MPIQQEMLFDLMESEADVNIFFDRTDDNVKAKNAALIIISSPIGHFPKKAGDKYTVWFGRGIERWCFKKFKDAIGHVFSLLQKASQNKEHRFSFRFEGKEKKRFEQEFAKVTVASKKEREFLRSAL